MPSRRSTQCWRKRTTRRRRSTPAMLHRPSKTAELTLSPTTGDFQGGLLICDGDVEVNCTFETLVRMVRNEVVGDVTKALFA